MTCVCTSPLRQSCSQAALSTGLGAALTAVSMSSRESKEAATRSSQSGWSTTHCRQMGEGWSWKYNTWGGAWGGSTNRVVGGAILTGQAVWHGRGAYGYGRGA